MPANIETSYAWKDGDATCLARVKMSGSLLLQATAATISRSVYLKEQNPGADRTLVSGPTALTVASVVFDTLQTDDRWDRDSTGYNFRDSIPYTVFSQAGRVYEVDYSFVGSGDQRFKVRFDIVIRE